MYSGSCRAGFMNLIHDDAMTHIIAARRKFMERAIETECRPLPHEMTMRRTIAWLGRRVLSAIFIASCIAGTAEGVIRRSPLQEPFRAPTGKKPAFDRFLDSLGLKVVMPVNALNCRASDCISPFGIATKDGAYLGDISGLRGDSLSDKDVMSDIMRQTLGHLLANQQIQRGDGSKADRRRIAAEMERLGITYDPYTKTFSGPGGDYVGNTEHGPIHFDCRRGSCTASSTECLNSKFSGCSSEKTFSDPEEPKASESGGKGGGIRKPK